MKNKKLLYGVSVVVLAIGGLVLFMYLSKPTIMPSKEPEEYYGSSTYGQCQTDNDCYISGCNSEICQSKAEEPIASICILPDKPTPMQLNYGCKCIDQKCQWSK